MPTKRVANLSLTLLRRPQPHSNHRPTKYLACIDGRTKRRQRHSPGTRQVSERRPRVELYLRSLAPTAGREEQERIVNRLQALDEQDRIDAVEVVLCGECVCPQSATADTDPGRQLIESYEQFRQWATERDRELVGFERRDTRSILTGTTVTGVVFPRVVLAEYRDGSLTHVAPSRNGSDETSVSDRLDVY